MSGRFKCTNEECSASFDDESERDRHVAFVPHCLQCGTSDERLLLRRAATGRCMWCAGSGAAADREGASALWH